jgi:2-iminoacetate synthase ThiH
VSSAGAITKASPLMLPNEIHRQIREAGFIPAQRNTNYDVLKVFATDDESPILQSIEDVGKAASSQGNWAPLTLLDD